MGVKNLASPRWGGGRGDDGIVRRMEVSACVQSFEKEVPKFSSLKIEMCERASERSSTELNNLITFPWEREKSPHMRIHHLHTISVCVYGRRNAIKQPQQPADHSMCKLSFPVPACHCFWVN